MLNLFQQLLGKDFWNFVVIIFTHVDEEVRDELDDAIEAVLDPTGKIKEGRCLRCYCLYIEVYLLYHIK